MHASAICVPTNTHWLDPARPSVLSPLQPDIGARRGLSGNSSSVHIACPGYPDAVITSIDFDITSTSFPLA